MAYPNSIGDIPLSGAIGLTSSADTYPTFIDQLGQGGLQTIDTIADRDSIPSARRSFGMLVSVRNEIPALNLIYRLCNIAMGGNSNTLTDNLNWLAFTGTGLTTTLAPGNIFVGDASSVATGVAMSGDATIDNAGVLTISANAVTYGQMQAMTTNTLLGSGSGTAVAEITLGTGLSFTGTTLNVTASAPALTTGRVGFGVAGVLGSDAAFLFDSSTKELRITTANNGTEAILVPVGAITGLNTRLQITCSNSAAGNFTGDATNVAAVFITANNITTVAALDVRSSSASTGVRSLVEVTNANSAAINTTQFHAYNQAPTSTNYFRQIKLTAVNAGPTVNTIWQGNGTATPNGLLTGTAGDFLVNGGSNAPAYCTGGTTWVTLGAGGTGDVTQSAAGTQTTNSIPFWTSSAKEISKASKLLWDDTNGGFSVTGITELWFGTDTNVLSNMYIGKGKTSATAAQVSLNGTGGLGADKAGGAINIKGGIATGSAYGGEVRIFTSDAAGSSSSPQSASENMTWTATNKATFAYGRVIQTEGNNVTAANNITLGNGNFFTINGNTQINTIAATGWSSAGANAGGSMVILLFTGTPTVKNNTAGTGAVILLAGSVDLVAANNTILGIVYDATNGVWNECFRKVA